MEPVVSQHQRRPDVPQRGSLRDHPQAPASLSANVGDCCTRLYRKGACVHNRCKAPTRDARNALLRQAGHISSRVFGVFDHVLGCERLYEFIIRGIASRATSRPVQAWHIRHGVAGLLVDAGAVTPLIGGAFPRAHIADMEAASFTAIREDLREPKYMRGIGRDPKGAATLSI